jgi:hypothetical protein
MSKGAKWQKFIRKREMGSDVSENQKRKEMSPACAISLKVAMTDNEG